MRKTLFSLLIFAALDAGAAPTVKHSLKVSLSPEAGTIEAEDAVSFPSPAGEFVFTLHKGLNPEAGPGTLEILTAAAAARYGINFSSAADIYDTYRYIPRKAAKGFTIKYKGPLSHPLGEQVEEYARSFSETPGIISKDGCYL